MSKECRKARNVVTLTFLALAFLIVIISTI